VLQQLQQTTMKVETNPCVRSSRQTQHIKHTTIHISYVRSTKRIKYIVFAIFIVEAMFPILPMRRCVSSVCGLAFKQSGSRIAGSSSFRKRALTQSSPIRIEKSPSLTSSITPTVEVTTPGTETTVTTSTAPAQQITATMVKKTSNTGGLRRLPMVKPPADLISSARKSLYKVKVDTEMKNIRLRIRKYGSETINTLMISLCVPLRDIVDGYKKEWKRLHPFERVVADLTASSHQKKDGLTLPVILSDIHEARKMILEAAKDWIFKIKNADTSRNANLYTEEGIESLIQLYETYASPSIHQLMEIQKSLRTTPIVQVDTPAVVLVGAPNVGKSSIVRAISSATPEVNNYPFTTRGMTLGHVEVFWSSDPTNQFNTNNGSNITSIGSGGGSHIVKAMVPDPRRKPGSVSPEVVKGKYAFSQLCQIMDSPGLLVRPDEERNEMEALTLAAMQHLPTAVCYVMDLTGNAGDKCSGIEDQLILRKEMRTRFPRRPWIDIVSKYDLGVEDSVLRQLEELLTNEDGTKVPYIKLSIHDGTGVQELRTETLRMLSEVRVVLDAMSVIQQQQQVLQQSRIQ
jgi:nucleolar GTP-binding protein